MLRSLKREELFVYALYPTWDTWKSVTKKCLLKSSTSLNVRNDFSMHSCPLLP